MLKQFLQKSYKLIFSLVAFTHLVLAVAVPFPVSRFPGGDKYTFVENKGVECENNNLPQPGQPCACANGGTLLINKKGASCHTIHEIVNLYQNWYKDTNSVSPGPRLLLHHDSKKMYVIMWDADLKKYKTPSSIFNVDGKVLDPSACSTTPVVDSVHCNVGSGELKPCAGIKPSYFSIKVVTSPAQVALQIATIIESDRRLLEGQLMFLKIKCGTTTTSPLSGYMVMKFEGTKDYELGGAPQTQPPQPQPTTTPPPSAVGSGDGSDEGEELEITRQPTTDIWTTKNCDKCSCLAGSSYMTNQFQTAACYSRSDLAITYGSQSIMELDKDPVFFYSYDYNSNKWKNPHTKFLYFFNSTIKVTEANCQLSNIRAVSVFNYNKWQLWNSVDYFVIEKVTGGYTILINSAYTGNFAGFQGHLLQLQLKCDKNPNNFLLFVKFSGKYEYNSKAPAIAAPIRKTETASDDNTAIIIGGAVGGVVLLCAIIVLVCCCLRRRRRKRRRDSLCKKNEKKEKEDLKAKIGYMKKLGDDDQVVMKKSDLMQFAETILQEKRSFTNSPRYVRSPPPIPTDPRPKIGPLSANFNPEDYNNDSFYSKIKEPKDDPQYEGLYLKPADDGYLANSEINQPKKKEEPKINNNSAYEVEINQPKKEEETKINNNSAYEVEDDGDSVCETVE